MNDTRARIRRMMQQLRQRSGLPSSSAIVSETFERLGYDQDVMTRNDILSNFSEYLKMMFIETLPTLEEYEERTYAEGIPRALMWEYPEITSDAEDVAMRLGFREGVAHLFQHMYPMLRRAFQSVDQSRKARGGKDFELQIEGLLNLAQVPFTRQDIRSRTDLILPSREVFDVDRSVSMVVSVKRTFRERWREVVEELNNLMAPNVFLFTAEERVSSSVVRRACRELGIHIVVWDEVKAAQYPNESLVLGYTQWADDRLKFLMREWDRRPAIPFAL